MEKNKRTSCVNLKINFKKEKNYSFLDAFYEAETSLGISPKRCGFVKSALIRDSATSVSSVPTKPSLLAKVWIYSPTANAGQTSS